MRYVVLDNGVFRDLVEAPTKAKFDSVVRVINDMIPLKLVSTFGLWPEYIGFARPPYRHPHGMSSYSSLNSIEQLNEVQRKSFKSLFDSYRSDSLLSAASLQQKAESFMSTRVSKTIREAYDIAHDIVYFKGQDFNGKPFSWDLVANQLCIDYTIDEIFYQTRFFPTAFFDSIVIFIRQMAETLKVYHHLPIYRLVDSTVEYLWRVHNELPDETSSKAKKTISAARTNMKLLKEGEFGDCMFLWTAIQGIFGQHGLQPTSVLSFDKQSLRRLELMIDLLKGEFRGESLFNILRESGNLSPGRLLILTQGTDVLHREIDIQNLLI